MFDMNANPLDNEESIKHLISGEPTVDIDDVIEYYGENGNFLGYRDYDDVDDCMDHNRYDLHMITKQIQTKKFLCEGPIGSGKSTAIRKWITSHSTERFMVIVTTVNIAEEFHAKLKNAFSEFHKAVQKGVNIIITTYNTASKC